MKCEIPPIAINSTVLRSCPHHLLVSRMHDMIRLVDVSYDLIRMNSLVVYGV